MKIYLDHAATTPVAPEVLEVMKPFFSQKFGNASSLHSFGQEAKEALENSRKTITGLINAEPDEIIFTSGGTESDNLALKGAAFGNKEKGNHIITSSIEHPAVKESCEALQDYGFEITYLPVDKFGLVNPEDIKKSIKPNTVLVSIMHANNEIGTIEPIAEIGKICKEKGILFHTDAVQTFGKVPIDTRKMNIDLLSASSHKIYGPKGVGFLYVKKGVKIRPQMHGGGHENGLRSGTENVSGIVGFAKAAELAAKNIEKEAKRETHLRDYLIKNILENIPDSYLNGHPEKRLPGNIHLRFDFVEGEALLLKLNDKGIAASTGSACSTKELKPSHVLTAIGLKTWETHGSLRITLGKDNTKEEIDYVLEKLPKAVEELRTMSPLGRKK